MVYGASISFRGDAHIYLQSTYNAEKLETLHFFKGRDPGKVTKFTLTGINVKVESNVFDFAEIELSEAHSGLVESAREKTTQATEGNKTLGSSVKIVQYWATGKPPRSASSSPSHRTRVNPQWRRSATRWTP